MTENEKTILVVEDEPFSRDLLVKKLVGEKFKVEIAMTGNEAIEKLRSFCPDLVILDLLLPDINGFGVLKSIRENKLTTDCPVIVLTNLDQQEDLEKGKALGISGYLIKANFTLDELMEHVKKAIV